MEDKFSDVFFINELQKFHVQYLRIWSHLVQFYTIWRRINAISPKVETSEVVAVGREL
jgi:hypothetical protein